MALVTLALDADFSGEALYDTLSADLPDYALPLFVRVGNGESALTETYKLALATLKTQGYSPARTDDPLYLLDRTAGGYVPLTEEALDRLETDGSGERQ